MSSLRPTDRLSLPLPRSQHWLACAAFALAACGPAQVLLRQRPGTGHVGTLGPVQRCQPGEVPCATSDIQDLTAQSNLSGTTRFSLPLCAHGVDSILVQNVNTPNPTALVQCSAEAPASSGGGLPVTGPNGSVVPPSH